MGQKVSYCRAVQKETGESELFKGNGIVTGVIIGASKRVQLLIQDNTENKDKAWTLDPICINATDEAAQAYFEHHQRIKKMVAEHNAANVAREKEKIAEVDAINAEMFGNPLVL
jgi:DNA-binding protein YbaB